MIFQPVSLSKSYVTEQPSRWVANSWYTSLTWSQTEAVCQTEGRHVGLDVVPEDLAVDLVAVQSLAVVRGVAAGDQQGGGGDLVLPGDQQQQQAGSPADRRHQGHEQPAPVSHNTLPHYPQAKTKVTWNFQSYPPGILPWVVRWYPPQGWLHWREPPVMFILKMLRMR